METYKTIERFDANMVLLEEYEAQLVEIEATIKSLQHTLPTPAVLARALDLAELRDHMRINVEDILYAMALLVCPEPEFDVN